MVTISIDIKDKDLMKWLREATSKNLTEAMKLISAIMEQDVFDHFETDKKDSKGVRWLPTKRPPAKGGTLLRNATLKNSMVKTYGTNFAKVSTNLKYAAIHNFGGIIKGNPFLSWADPQTGQKIVARQVKIPQREFMYISERALDRIEKVLLREIAEGK